MGQLKYLILLMVLSPSLATHQHIHDDERPVVTTEAGAVRGLKMNSRSGREYYSFTKIPYAKPPVGDLRFKNAEPAESWEGVLDADKKVPDCMQILVYDPLRSSETFGTEDCLYLNVFTPKISEGAKLPVLIYIHGGGWRCELPANGPNRAKYFMDEDVILVSFHYRLGILGFMSLEDSVLPGNIGLKDQSMAIKWVSNNIEKFGGDPKKITLFGNSAGGASTHYHLISPMSKDRVQGGISQSGYATCLWALSPPGVAEESAHRIAEHLNCPVESSEEIVKCLRTKSAKEVTDAERLFIDRDFDPPVAFPPVIEKGVENPFLPESPHNMIVEKPWVIGLTSEDGAFKLPGYIINPELMKSFEENMADILPNALMFSNTTTNPHEVAKQIIDKYYSKEKPYETITNIFTDGFFTFCMKEASKKAKGPLYVYLFNYRGKTTVLDLIGKRTEKDFSDLGVAHTEEIMYLLNFEDEMEPDMKSEDDDEVSKRLVNMWATFAKNNEMDDWPQYNQEDGKYLKISRENSVESKLWPERTNFWTELKVRDNMEKMNV